MSFTFKNSTVENSEKFYDGPSKVDLKVTGGRFKNVRTVFHVRDGQDINKGNVHVRRKLFGPRFERFIDRNKGKLTVAGLVANFANLIFRVFGPGP